MNTFESEFQLASELFQKYSDDFELYRNGKFLKIVKGHFCSNDYPDSIQIHGSDLIELNDELTHLPTNQTYKVYEAKPLTFAGSLKGYIIKYKDETHSVNQNTYHIGNVSGTTAIGTNASIQIMNQSSDDLLTIIDRELPFSKEKTELLQYLLQLKNEDIPLEKNKLSKFSDLLKKHENLILPLSAFITKMLFGLNE